MKKTLLSLAYALMFITPVLTFPKLPKIPNLTDSVKLPTAVQEETKRVGADAVKNLNIDFGKLFK
jgi:hypothetical protein